MVVYNNNGFPQQIFQLQSKDNIISVLALNVVVWKLIRFYLRRLRISLLQQQVIDPNLAMRGK